jgi:Na+/H+ antiporter NhaD/arsenite permease-like protein
MTLQDSSLWQLIAYCAGTGGSLLVIGSAAGVALMGMEKVDFLWYAKRVSLSALAGYVAGIGTYVALSQMGLGKVMVSGALYLAHSLMAGGGAGTM